MTTVDKASWTQKIIRPESIAVPKSTERLRQFGYIASVHDKLIPHNKSWAVRDRIKTPIYGPNTEYYDFGEVWRTECNRKQNSLLVVQGNLAYLEVQRRKRVQPTGRAGQMSAFGG